MRRGNSIGNLCCVVTWSCACALGISGCLPKNDSQPSTITTASLPAGVVDQPYSGSVSGSGGSPPYTWAVSPALPATLALNGSTGAITGTPGAEGTSSHTFSMIDSASPPQVVQKALTLTIKPVPAALSITTTLLPDGFVGQNYNQPVIAAGGTVPLSWSIIAGTLPLILNLNQSTGVISGTPTASGTSSFTVRVADSGGQEDTQALSIRINPPSPPTITTISLPGGTVGLGYSEDLTATGGTGTLAWSLSGGSLPANLSISPTGTISGTPTNAGTSNFTVRVIDSLAQSDTQSLAIAISSALTITTSSPLPNAEVDKAYSKTLARSGGVSPFTWSVTPALPTGLNLEAPTGKISGTPAAGTTGTYSLTFTVQDSSTLTPQTASKVLSLTVIP